MKRYLDTEFGMSSFPEPCSSAITATVTTIDRWMILLTMLSFIGG